MQASASSQTNSPANIPAPQGKTDVHKADAATPFAILVASVAAKDLAQGAKQDVKDAGSKPVDDKFAVSKNAGKQNDIKREDNKQDTAPARTDSQDKPSAPAKAEKQEDPAKAEKNSKDKDRAETDKDSDGDRQFTAAAQQSPDQQPPPPTPIVQALNIVSADTDVEADTQEGIAIDGASAKAAVPAPGMDVPRSDPLSAEPQIDPVDPKTQPQVAAQAGPADDSQATQTAAAQPVAAPTVASDLKPAKDTVKPAAVKTAAKTDDTAKPESVEPAKDELTPAAESGDQTVHDAGAKLAKSDVAKDEGTNTTAPKTHAAHEAGNSKTDAGVSDIQKADAPQIHARAEEADSAALLPKPAPQSAPQSNAALAINTIAAPQAAQHAQAPTATQHVQVTAQPAPNLPALAVEISAKSQSGAKQFDIRLDPPELGRVEVRLSIDATGKASAHLSADQPQTLSLLQKDAPVLARALREAGLDVSQDGLNFSLRQQAHDQGGHDGNNGRFGGARNFTLAATSGIDPAAASFAYRAPADGRVDIRV